MKSFCKFLLVGSALLSMSLTGCGGNSQPKDENEVSVFFLSGQSNMEGKTNARGLGDAFTELGLDDYADVAAGLKEVPGITGSADQAAEKFAKGQLKGNFEAKCNHHGEHHSH